MSTARSQTPDVTTRIRGLQYDNRCSRRVFCLTLVLYAVMISVDAIRKVAGLPQGVIGIVYVVTGITYIVFFISEDRKVSHGTACPTYFPLLLVMLSAWCIGDAIAPGIPVGMAILGGVTYVFFAPLFYVGSDLMSDEQVSHKALKIVALTGSVVGMGAIISALLGSSAPTLLQPIDPTVAIHNSNYGNVYLAPSIFASAEEAAEYLVVAFFAWAALAAQPKGKMRPTVSVAVGILILGGLIAAERRADIYVAVGGILVLLLLDRVFPPAGSRRYTFPRGLKVHGNIGVPLMLAAIVSVVLISVLGSTKLVSFLTDTDKPGSYVAVLFGIGTPVSFAGQGTGTSTQGGYAVGTSESPITNSQGTYPGYLLGGRTFRLVEGGLDKTLIELGWVGVALYGAVFCSVIAPLVMSIRRLDSVGRALTILAIALGIVFLKGHASLDDPILQPLFWLSVGGAWGRRAMQPQTRKHLT